MVGENLPKTYTKIDTCLLYKFHVGLKLIIMVVGAYVKNVENLACVETTKRVYNVLDYFTSFEVI